MKKITISLSKFAINCTQEYLLSYADKLELELVVFLLNWQ